MSKDKPKETTPEVTANIPYSDFSEAGADGRVALENKEALLLTPEEIKAKNLSPKETLKEVSKGRDIILRSSFLAPWQLIMALSLSILLVVLLTLYYPPVVPYVRFIPAFILLIIILVRMDSKFIIEAENITHITGIVRLHPTIVRLHFNKISGVEVRRNLYEYLMKLGDLRISTHMFEQPELNFRGLHNPFFYAALLRERLPKPPEN